MIGLQRAGKTKILSLLLVLCLLAGLMPMAALAAGDVTNDNYGFDSATGTLTIKTNASTAIISDGPGYVSTNWRHTSSGINFKDVRTVIIENGVTEIGEAAFYGCESLASVKIPASVTSIGRSAFWGCKSLASVKIPDSATSIGDAAFSRCESLTSVTIPAGVMSIGEHTFSQCKSLTAVNVAAGNPNFASIDGVLYRKSGGSVSSVLLCPPSMAGALMIPAGVTSIGNSAFYQCTVLTSVKIPDSVTSIGDSAFADCTALTSVNIPTNVTSIEKFAFLNCKSLTSVTIPDSVTSICDIAFAKCTSLTIVLTGINAPTFGTNWAEEVPLVYYPAVWGASAVTNYSGTLVPDPAETEDYSFSIATGTLTIKTDKGFDNWQQTPISPGGLKTVNIQSGVTFIGSFAFAGRSSLTSVTIPPSVTSIDNSAFVGCSSLTAINVAEGNPNFASIGGLLYSKSGGNVSSLLFCPPGKAGALTIPDGVTCVGESAFENCTTLTSVAIPLSVTSIGEYAFSGCTGLTIVLMGETPPTFGENWADGVPAVYYPAAWGDPASIENLNASFNAKAIINIAPIGGVTAPVRDAVPVSTITETAQYTGSITWKPADSPFKASTVYTATITLIPKTGYTLTGVAANFFNIAGVTSTNAANSSVITAVFPATSSAPSGGSGRGSSSTPTTPNYNADLTAVNGSNSALPITFNTANGTANVNVSLQSLGQGRTSITVPSIAGAHTYTVNIPVSSLSAPDAQSTMTISTNAGSVTVPSKMLTGVSGISGKEAGISIGQGAKDRLPNDVKAAIGEKPLIQLTLSIDGKQADWSNPDVPVTVRIPYTPTTAELANPESIVVWYIDGSGNAVTIPNGHYDVTAGTVTFQTTHFSDYAVAFNKESFKDVESSVWYHEAVNFIAAREITRGTEGGNYSPESKLTRGEFIVLMMRAYGIAQETTPTENFSDGGNTYYTGYLAAAKHIGITAGVGNNMYAPDKEITRQEMFTLLYNTLKMIGQLPTGDSGKSVLDFSDSRQIDTWAKEAMSTFVVTGTIGGSDGKLTPQGKTTRAEMAQVLYNLLWK